jgi:hypothetical protein
MYRPELIEVDPMRITFNAKNPRKHQGGEFDRLKQSVKEVGVVQLPSVRVVPGGFYEVIDGEGRVRSAQEAHRERIWVVNLGQVSDEDALTMMQSANSVREFGFIAECRGMANMHRGGASTETIAKKMGYTTPVATHLINIGYFPDELFEMMSGSTPGVEPEGERVTWGHKTIRELLPLRQLLPGAKEPTHGIIEGVYDYSEVKRAIEHINRQKFSSWEQISSYVEQRRRTLFEQRFNQELQVTLAQQLADATSALEAAKQEEITALTQELQQRHAAQVTALQKQLDNLEHERERLIVKAAKMPEEIEKLQKELTTKLQAAQAERERLQTLQSQLKQEAQATQAQAERARQELLANAAREAEALQKKRLAEAENSLKAYYEEKDRTRQRKAENDLRSMVAEGIQSLAKTQQWMNLLTSQKVLQGLHDLSGAELAALLLQLRIAQDSLARAETTIRDSETTIVDEEHIIDG